MEMEKSKKVNNLINALKKNDEETWEYVFKIMDELRKRWAKKPLSEKERSRLKKLFEAYSKEKNENIVKFSYKLENVEDRILWEELLLAFRNL